MNYRFQRSERSIRAALDDLFASGEVGREALVISTKGGFIPFDTHPPTRAGGFHRLHEENLFRAGSLHARGYRCELPLHDARLYQARTRCEP